MKVEVIPYNENRPSMHEEEKEQYMNSFHKKCAFLLFVLIFLISSPLSAGEGATVALKTNAGKSFQVFVGGPKDASRGILLVHGWWGLNEQVQSWVNKFAALGYRAMAVDLYDGRVATTPDKARTYMNSVKQAEANAKYAAALKTLQKPGRKLAILGWSFGASQSFQATLVAPEKISATVMYYPFGKIVQSGNNMSSLHGPILVIRAKIESPSNIKETTRLINLVKGSGKTIKEHTFNGKHGFANPAAKHYSAQASEAAWQKVKEFLDNQLK